MKEFLNFWLVCNVGACIGFTVAKIEPPQSWEHVAAFCVGSLGPVVALWLVLKARTLLRSAL